MKAGIDVVRHVWSEGYDEPLTVSPSAECPGYVQVGANGKEAEEFWGKAVFTLPAEMALKLSVALSECALEQMLAREDRQ